MHKLRFRIARWLIGYMKIELRCPHGAFWPGHYMPGSSTHWGCEEDGCVKLDITYVKNKKA